MNRSETIIASQTIKTQDRISTVILTESPKGEFFRYIKSTDPDYNVEMGFADRQAAFKRYQQDLNWLTGAKPDQRPAEDVYIADGTRPNAWGDIDAKFYQAANPTAAVRVTVRHDINGEPTKPEVNWYGSNGYIADAKILQNLLTAAIEFAETLKGEK